MRNRLLLAAVALLGLLSVHPRADVSVSFIEYRLLADIGQVRLTTGFVHDPETQTAMLASLAAFDKKGIVLVAGDAPRTVTRHERIGSHIVDTTIAIYPATGRGFGGGLATAGLLMTVDSKKVIDCPYEAGSVSLADIGILPRDGMMSIAGSYDDKHITGIAALDGSLVIDLAWLQRNAR